MRDFVCALVKLAAVAPVTWSVSAPVAVLHEDGLARLVHQLSKVAEVLKFAAACASIEYVHAVINKAQSSEQSSFTGYCIKPTLVPDTMASTGSRYKHAYYTHDPETQEDATDAEIALR